MSALEELMGAALSAPESRRAEALRVLRGEVAAAPSPQREGPLLLGMGEAARYLGVSRPTMWRMIRDGRLEKVELLPGSYRMRRSDLDAYAANNGTGGRELGDRSNGCPEERTQRTARKRNFTRAGSRPLHQTPEAEEAKEIQE